MAFLTGYQITFDCSPNLFFFSKDSTTTSVFIRNYIDLNETHNTEVVGFFYQILYCYGLVIASFSHALLQKYFENDQEEGMF